MGMLPSSPGCGISWTVPVTHFDGVDERGYVCYSQRIAEIDLGEGLKLPLIINFRSDRESSSPYLGKGWILALLDSRFVQTGESSFEMLQPDGWVRPFYRDGADSSILNGGADWKAEIKGELIIAFAGCGWKLTYTKGRLTSIGTPKNRHLKLVYSGGKVVEFEEKGASRLSVEFDPANGQARSLSFNGKRLVISHDQRPRVETVAGQNVVAGTDQSLSRISPGGGSDVGAFQFSVDSQLNPMLAVTALPGLPREFAWDPKTRLVSSDGIWSYEFPVEHRPPSVVSFKRRSPEGTESFHIDQRVGLEESSATNGERTIRRWFISGKMSGKPRSLETISAGGVKTTTRMVYDETGKLVREVRESPENTLAISPLSAAALASNKWEGEIPTAVLKEPAVLMESNKGNVLYVIDSKNGRLHLYETTHQ